jgi:glucokinase
MAWVGIDIGGTNTKAALLGDDGRTVLEQDSAPTHRAGPAEALEGAAALARRFTSREEGVRGVGLTVPGHFDALTGTTTLIPNIPGPWAGFPVRTVLSEALSGAPVTLINDARAFGLAESRLGAARGHQVVIAVTLGTGLGGAVIVGGRLFGGSTGLAGEIGHMVIKDDGPLCGCGNRGCLEALTRSDVVAAQADSPTMAEAAARASAGDPRARRALADAGRWIGLALANVTTLLSPDAVVVGGGVSGAGELLLGPMRDELRNRAPLVPAGALEILQAALGTNAGAIGAALAAKDASPSEESTAGAYARDSAAA